MKLSYPNIKQSFGLLGIYILITLVASVALMSIQLPASANTFLTLLVANTLFIIVALNLKNADVDFLFQKGRRVSVMVFIVVAFFDVFYIIVMDPIVSLIPMPEAVAELFKSLMQKDLLSYLAIGIVAPVTEELMFRKLMLEGLEKNYGPRKAIIWSALLFAIFHLNPWQGISAFCIGLFLGWLYLNTRNIWLCIFLHFFNNSLAFLAYYYSDNAFFSVIDFTGSGYQLFIVMGLSAICMYFCYKFLERQFKLNRHDPAEQKT